MIDTAEQILRPLTPDPEQRAAYEFVIEALSDESLGPIWQNLLWHEPETVLDEVLGNVPELSESGADLLLLAMQEMRALRKAELN